MNYAMTKKFFLLALLCAGVYLLDSCCDNNPYFDYKRVFVEGAFAPLTGTNDTVLALTVYPDEIEYLASAQGSGLTAPLYGGCKDPGESGPKNAMASVEITADRNFNDTLPTGASLNSIFLDARSTSTTPISEDISGLEFLLPQWNFVVYTKAKPKLLNEVFAFTVKVTKADGSTAQGKIINVKFK